MTNSKTNTQFPEFLQLFLQKGVRKSFFFIFSLIKKLAVNTQDNKGETALHKAIKIEDPHDRETSVKILISNKIDISLQNKV